MKELGNDYGFVFGDSLDPSLQDKIRERAKLDIKLPTFVSIFDAPIYARNYLFSRLSSNLAREYKVQYCYEKPYAHRIIFPVYWGDKMVYFQARCIDKQSQIRYMNPRREDILLGKSEIVFNIDRVQDRCIIFEGWLNAVSVPEGGVATFGKGISDSQVELLIAGPFGEYVVFFDLDGLRESVILAEQLLYRGAKKVRIAMSETDANEDSAGCQKAIEEAVEVSITDIWRVRSGLV
jgi:hypothetical protein